LNPDLHTVLRKAWDEGFTTRSDFARNHADHIAIASFLGLISTLCPGGTWGRKWRLTATGYKVLFSESD